MLPERFSQNPLETYFCQHLWKNKLQKINYPSMALVMPALFETKRYSIQYQLIMQEMKNINFESNRTSPMSEKIQTKLYLFEFFEYTKVITKFKL